jgi:periplasmic protein TonB
MQAAKLVRQVKPTYPPLAQAMRLQGTVRFRATIAVDGRIKGLVTLGGSPPLVQSAADAVKQWRYQPTVLNGEAVEVVTEIDVSFSL